MPESQPIAFVLGLGSIGAILASHLEKQTSARVVPLLRSKEKVSALRVKNSTIGVRTLFEKGHPIEYTAFSHVSSPETFLEDVTKWTSNGLIDNLVITTKTYQTKEAIKPYLRYVHSKTNIILIQNGLGVLEVLKKEVFLDFHPNLFQGVISHGVFQDSENSCTQENSSEHSILATFIHAGFGSLKIARLPWEESEMIQQTLLLEEDNKNNELVKLLNTEGIHTSLNIEHVTYQELLLVQLEKFLVNSCINPITSILDCINGELNEIARVVFGAIITECLDVFKIAYKPLFDYELLDIEKLPKLDVSKRLSFKRVLDHVMDIGCVVNGENRSSMREDVLKLRDTEVACINGYIEQLCSKYKLPESYCKVNKTIETLVNLRLNLNRFRGRKRGGY